MDYINQMTVTKRKDWHIKSATILIRERYKQFKPNFTQ